MSTLLQRYPAGKWRPEAEYLRGVSFFRLRNYAEAANLFKSFWRDYPRHPLIESTRYVSAWSLLYIGQHSEARKTFENMLLDYPGTRLSDPIFWGIVRTYLGAGDVEKALFLQQRFLSHFLKSPWVEQISFDIGQYYFDKKEFGNAAAIFRRFLWTYPENEFKDMGSFHAGGIALQSERLPGRDHGVS